jgi:hypothetical protein
VKAGAVSGAANVVAKATVGAVANEWQYSVDEGKTYVDLPTTSGAKTRCCFGTARDAHGSRRLWSVAVPLVVS